MSESTSNSNPSLKKEGICEINNIIQQIYIELDSLTPIRQGKTFQ